MAESNECRLFPGKRFVESAMHVQPAVFTGLFKPAISFEEFFEQSMAGEILTPDTDKAKELFAEFGYSDYLAEAVRDKRILVKLLSYANDELNPEEAENDIPGTRMQVYHALRSHAMGAAGLDYAHEYVDDSFLDKYNGPGCLDCSLKYKVWAIGQVRKDRTGRTARTVESILGPRVKNFAQELREFDQNHLNMLEPNHSPRKAR